MKAGLGGKGEGGNAQDGTAPLGRREARTAKPTLSREPSHPLCPPQENRLTQERIDAALGADLLGRAVFYGQSDITALLEVRRSGSAA